MINLNQQKSGATRFSIIDQVIHFLVKSGNSSKQSHETTRRDFREEVNVCQSTSGGYNDAFIVQHWTSYNPRF